MQITCSKHEKQVKQALNKRWKRMFLVEAPASAAFVNSHSASITIPSFYSPWHLD